MFAGMPTYQLSSPQQNNMVKVINSLHQAFHRTTDRILFRSDDGYLYRSCFVWAPVTGPPWWVPDRGQPVENFLVAEVPGGRLARDPDGHALEPAIHQDQGVSGGMAPVGLA